MKTLLKSVWVALNGKKTLLSLLSGVVYALAVSLGVADRNQAVEDTILAGLGLGLGHRVYKA